MVLPYRITDRDFIQFMNHFIAHTRPSNEQEVALFLDIHSSQLSIEVICIPNSVLFPFYNPLLLTQVLNLAKETMHYIYYIQRFWLFLG